MYNLLSALIIHSEREENNQICQSLTNQGYQCKQVFHSKDIDTDQTYDCIILKDDFPNININETIVQFKLNNHPIIIILTDTISNDYLENLLNAGADDYLTTPYKTDDIDIKIQSVYKNGLLKPRRVYLFKDIVLDMNAKTCSCHKKPLNLTKNEFKLLSILMKHPYQPFSISYLFEHIWGSTLYEDRTSVPSLINNLIIKLRLANPQEEYIKRFGKDNYKMAF
jgi:DNA-binding response OmpR family regulator